MSDIPSPKKRLLVAGSLFIGPNVIGVVAVIYLQKWIVGQCELGLITPSQAIDRAWTIGLVGRLAMLSGSILMVWYALRVGK